METLDLHCQLILDEYRDSLPLLEQMKEEVLAKLREALDRNGLYVTAIEARIKTEESLAGKLALKGAKYATLEDITDVLGARIITFYTDDVDRVAVMAEQMLPIMMPTTRRTDMLRILRANSSTMPVTSMDPAKAAPITAQKGTPEMQRSVNTIVMPTNSFAPEEMPST